MAPHWEYGGMAEKKKAGRLFPHFILAVPELDSGIHNVDPNAHLALTLIFARSFDRNYWLSAHSESSAIPGPAQRALHRTGQVLGLMMLISHWEKAGHKFIRALISENKIAPNKANTA